MENWERRSCPGPCVGRRVVPSLVGVEADVLSVNRRTGLAIGVGALAVVVAGCGSIASPGRHQGGRTARWTLGHAGLESTLGGSGAPGLWRSGLLPASPQGPCELRHTRRPHTVEEAKARLARLLVVGVRQPPSRTGVWRALGKMLACRPLRACAAPRLRRPHPRQVHTCRSTFSEDDQVILCEQASMSGPFVALMYFWPAVSPTRRQPHLWEGSKLPPIPQPRDGGATPERGSRRG